VIQARELVPRDVIGYSDPYAVIRIVPDRYRCKFQMRDEHIREMNTLERGEHIREMNTLERGEHIRERWTH
jgi:hypothetical protein